jgi:hypothetical protein
MLRLHPCIHHLLVGLLVGLTAYGLAFSAVHALEVRDER